MPTEGRCDTCPRYQSLLDETADFARRVAIADAKAADLQQNGLGVLAALHDSVDSLQQSTSGLVEDDLDLKLQALTLPEDQVPDLHKQADAMAQQLMDSIPQLQQRRHDELDRRLDTIAAIPAFCEQMGRCGMELNSLTN